MRIFARNGMQNPLPVCCQRRCKINAFLPARKSWAYEAKMPANFAIKQRSHSRVLSLFSHFAHNALDSVRGTPAFNFLAIHAIVMLHLSSRAKIR